MVEGTLLPPGMAYAIIAFLLSLLPAGLFIWLWYLRRHDRPVPAEMVALAFLAGIVLVWPAFWFEGKASEAWYSLSPDTAHYFAGSVFPLQTMRDVALPAIATFLVVATVEEGLRFLLLAWWIRRSKVIDQVFDGLVIGIASGLGFATLENTLYFLGLFEQGNIDTLVFVFFLRFMISTLAHVSFGGLMGAMLAQAVFQVYWVPKKHLYVGAFLIPWFIHGLYDLLLGLNQTTYAVLMLLAPLFVLISWAGRKEFFVVSRVGGQILLQQTAPDTKGARVLNKLFKELDTPWNKYAPWLREKKMRYNLIRDLEEE